MISQPPENPVARSFTFLGKERVFGRCPGTRGEWHLRVDSNEGGWHSLQLIKLTYGWTAYLYCEGGRLESENKVTEQEALDALESVVTFVVESRALGTL